MWKVGCASLLLPGVEADTTSTEQADFIEKLFAENARHYAELDADALYADENDLVWVNDPKQWHQQMARIVDHHFTSFDDLVIAARNAKQAGVSALMLVEPQKTAACQGGWYGGLQLCDHINGSFPARDGDLEKWKRMLADVKPMRFMWWANMDYWSVQGEVWSEAKASHTSDVGQWFSWGATNDDQCWGSNPSGAQGSWGSKGEWSGAQSALASWGSESYASYLVDALANSWTKNLGIDGYCIDCITCYQEGIKQCQSGMLQTDGNAMAAWSKIVQRVRRHQPQVVMSGETYNSWKDVIMSNSDIGGQGFESYHDRMQQAIWNGDASGLEDIASTSGADAATVLCYLNPFYDGKQPGACPSMYFRDTTKTMDDVRQYRMWVALEAASGVVPQHDANGGSFWDPPSDPFDDTTSPLWSFTKYRALNRLALRTKLPVSGSHGALAYLKHDSMGPRGSAAILLFNPGKAGNVTVNLSMLPTKLFGTEPYDLLNTSTLATSSWESHPHTNCYEGHGAEPVSGDTGPVGTLDLAQCEAACMKSSQCQGIVMENTSDAGKAVKCWRYTNIVVAGCHYSGSYNLWMKSAPPPLAPVPPLSAFWTVEMGAMDMKFLSGFSLGVFAPRQGKKTNCKPDDQYKKGTAATTLQACFLECLTDIQCENVFVEYLDVVWMEKPKAVTCTLLGAIKNPASACEQGTGTLINKLPGERSCAHLWTGESPPLAPGAPAVLPAPPSAKCPRLHEDEVSAILI